uniref:helix-turn-helix domain-containing protein n=1 Tax=Streptomyces corallincola TaxID=2851888 RepID=UPI0027E24F6F|nr:helix-turn-helix domain-containing protein [Streptomyces corallincola]
MAGRAEEDTPHPPREPGADWAGQLLDLLRPGARDPRRIVAWLGGAVGAAVCLQEPGGRLVAGRPVPLDTAVLTDVVAGRISAAALEDGTRYVRVVGISHPERGPAAGAVLTVARPEPFDRRAADIVVRAASVLELLLRERESADAGRRLDRATADLRLAILQLLMVEDTVFARRVAAGLWPGLLEGDTARVYVIETTPGERHALAEACAEATSGTALVVRCPAVDAHVIVVGLGPGAGDRLAALLDGRPGTFLGGSLRQRLARTATAYGQAVSALAVARFRPGRAAVYAERTHPELLMDPDGLRAWSARVLRPLDTLPHHIRAELLATTRLGLEFTAVNAAKVLGVSRNTVRARMDRVQSLTGADLSRLTARAAAHVAVNTEAVHGPYGDPYDGHGSAAEPAGLGGLLAPPALRDWAEDLLARLDADGRDLRRTLRAWIAADANAERAARHLGVHAQTVREHVRAAEPVLERQLLATGSDLYEVVLAHIATGALAAPALDGANGGQPDAPVHE